MRSSQWKHLRALSPSVDEKSPVGCSPTGLLISVRRRHLYLPPLPERGLHLAQVAPNLLRIGPRTRQARLGKVCKDRHGFGTTHGGRQRLRRAPVQEAIRFIRTCELHVSTQARPTSLPQPIPEDCLILSGNDAERIVHFIYY